MSDSSHTHSHEMSSPARIIRRATPLLRASLVRRAAIPVVRIAATPVFRQTVALPRFASAVAVKEAPVGEEAAERVLPVLREKDLATLRRQRNIGVSAHIDSGKSSDDCAGWIVGLTKV